MSYEDSDEEILKIDSKIDFLNRIIQPSRTTSRPQEPALTKPKKRKTSSVIKRKVAIKTAKSPEPYDTDEKIRERVRFMTGKIFESRRYLHADKTLGPEKLFKWVMDFLSERGYWPLQDTKDKGVISLYAVLMGLRLKGIYLDPRLLSLEFDVPFKLFQKCIFECMPFITSTSVIDRRIIYESVSLDRYSLYKEYSNLLHELAPGIEEDHVKEFEDRTRYLFDLLSQRGVCDDEKQFCVTSDKIFIYGIFEFMKKIFPDKTERTVCDQLSERFSIPRVTIEKMKRLVNKTLKKGFGES